MSNLHFKNGLGALFQFLKSIGVGLLTFVGLLTTLISSVQLLRNEDSVTWKVILLLGISVVWVSCFYAYFKKASPVRNIGFTGGKTGHKYLFSNRIRWFALAGIFCTPIFAISSFLTWKYVRDLPSDKTIILVAEFKSLDGQNYGVTEKIIERLNVETRQYPDIKVVSLGKPITAQEGSTTAREIANVQKARILLWGWYKKAPENVLITAHFEVQQKPKNLKLRQEQQDLIQPAIYMDKFDIQTQLSNEMTYLTLFTIGLARLESGDNVDAVSLFNKALDQRDVPEQLIDPAHIYFFRGNAFLDMKSYDKAIKDYTESLKITPENVCTPCAYSNRATAHYALSKFDEALADAIESRKRDAAPASIHYNLGLLYEMRGDIDNAILSYTEVLNRDINHCCALSKRSSLFFKKKEYEKAIKDYDVRLQRDPDDWFVLKMRGMALARVGNYNRAINDLNRFRFLHQGSHIHDWSADITINTSDFINDLSKYSSMIKSDPGDYDAYLKRARLFYEVGDFESTIADLTEAIRLKDDLGEAYHQRGIAHEDNENKSSAIADFSKYLELSQDEAKRNEAKGHLWRLGVPIK